MKKNRNDLRTACLFAITFAVVLALMNVSFAETPGFDCFNATTEVEKFICASPLIVFDQRMSLVYRDLYELLKPGEKKALQKEQREWLKKRDKEFGKKTTNDQAEEFLEDIYGRRIGELHERILEPDREEFKASQKGPEKEYLIDIKETDLTTKLYPPYPDVWDCPMSNIEWTGASNSFLPSGDILFKHKSAIREDGSTGYLFFKNEKMFIPYNSWDSIEKSTKDKKFYRTSKIVLPDGTQVENIYPESSVLCSWEYGGPNLIVRNKEGKVIARKAMLYLLDRPKKKIVGTNCEEFEDFKTYVNCTAGIMYSTLVPLEDNTFLACPKVGNYIVRLDKDLNTKSKLLNEKIFLVDGDEWDRFYREITKKGFPNNQEINDLLVEYINKIKKGKKQ